MIMNAVRANVRRKREIREVGRRRCGLYALTEFNLVKLVEEHIVAVQGVRICVFAGVVPSGRERRHLRGALRVRCQHSQKMQGCFFAVITSCDATARHQNVAFRG